MCVRKKWWGRSMENDKKRIGPEAEDRSKTQISQVSTAVLAYIGDAVYEMWARQHVFRRGLMRPDRLHAAATGYVRAEAQSAAFGVLWDELSPDEQAVARRGKNHRITSMPHNVDPLTYKKATAFEALIGYLHLAGDEERERYIIEKTFQIIENSRIESKRYRKTGNEQVR